MLVNDGGTRGTKGELTQLAISTRELSQAKKCSEQVVSPAPFFTESSP
jgi:hypothetical protein